MADASQLMLSDRVHQSRSPQWAAHPHIASDHVQAYADGREGPPWYSFTSCCVLPQNEQDSTSLNRGSCACRSGSADCVASILADQTFQLSQPNALASRSKHSL